MEQVVINLVQINLITWNILDKQGILINFEQQYSLY